VDIERIKALREKLGLSQEAAAIAAGMAGRQNWNAIEAGRHTNITVDVLERMATVLKTTAKDLLK
jgi:transcriptional regulator with XRE-family HTH domain